MFSADGLACYKSRGCHELDAKYGDVKLAIVDHETSLMISLQNEILAHAVSLIEAVNAAAQLDS